MDLQDTSRRILELKAEKNATILAHYYQEAAIQDVADVIGDSLYLARQATRVKEDILIMAGVSFMAETVKILNPHKKVLLPDTSAGCSLADSCSPQEFGKFIQQYPDHLVVSYVNCSAEIKAMSDLVCTSSNAVEVIRSVPEDQPVIFAPDRNLGRYLIRQTGRDLLLWDGACMVHEAFSIDKLLELYRMYPASRIIAHPESEEHILKTASYVGSTAGMLDYVKRHDSGQFIVATEAGILYQMQKEVPNAKLIPAPVQKDNSCACSECSHMKVNTLEKLYLCLKNETPEMNIEEDIRQKALLPIVRMLELSEN